MSDNLKKMILEATDISVKFKIPKKRISTLKEFVLTKIKGQKMEYSEFEALKSVSISLSSGECVGLIGHNGSGKSTLFKVLAGILKPKTGHVRYDGRLTSLIELGVGFDGELTAVDNIYLSCSLMGIPKKEIEKHVEEIIDFAELRDFLDFRVKNYSSGMNAKLGFACTTIIDTDIILIDEVLAVGDERFQRKCNDRIVELKQKGKGIILVTHDMHAVEKFCDRVYVLDHGELKFNGNVKEGISKFRNLLGG